MNPGIASWPRAIGWIGVFCLIATGDAAAQSLRVETHTGSVDGLLANSHLIAGPSDGLLIDAQLTRSDARDVVAMIGRHQLKQLTVFITHGHADHYLGLAEIVDAFPRTRVFSSAATATIIAQHGAQVRDRWTQSLGSDIAERVIVPEVLRGREIKIEREAFRVIELRSDSESVRPSVIYSRDRGWLFAGDLVFSGVHLRLEEGRAKKWRTALATLEALGPIETIYPGHGAPGPAGLIERNRAYLTRFIELTNSDATRDEMFDAMTELYPAHLLPFFLRRSVDAVDLGASQ